MLYHVSVYASYSIELDKTFNTIPLKTAHTDSKTWTCSLLCRGKKPKGFSKIVKSQDIDTVLADADFLYLALPETPETWNAMPP